MSALSIAEHAAAIEQALRQASKPLRRVPLMEATKARTGRYGWNPKRYELALAKLERAGHLWCEPVEGFLGYVLATKAERAEAALGELPEGLRPGRDCRVYGHHWTHSYAAPATCHHCGAGESW